MRTRITASLATIGLLALTACGSTDPDDLSEEDRQAVAEDVIMRDMLDCEDDETVEECEVRYEEETTAEIEESIEEYDAEMEDITGRGYSSEDTDYGDYSDRAATEELAFGQSTTYDSPETGGELAFITLRSIDSNYECDGPAMAVEVELNTVGMSEGFTLEGDMLIFIDEDGEAMDLVDAPGCDEQDTMTIGADDEVTETVVFHTERPAERIAVNGYDSAAYWVAPGVANNSDSDDAPEAANPESEGVAEDATESNGEAVEAAEPAELFATLPSAAEVDFYAPMSHPDELMVDINTIGDCETADIIWGGLQNGEMEGFDINYQYLGLLENWMMGQGCW